MQRLLAAAAGAGAGRQADGGHGRPRVGGARARGQRGQRRQGRHRGDGAALPGLRVHHVHVGRGRWLHDGRLEARRVVVGGLVVVHHARQQVRGGREAAQRRGRERERGRGGGLHARGQALQALQALQAVAQARAVQRQQHSFLVLIPVGVHVLLVVFENVQRRGSPGHKLRHVVAGHLAHHRNQRTAHAGTLGTVFQAGGEALRSAGRRLRTAALSAHGRLVGAHGAGRRAASSEQWGAG